MALVGRPRATREAKLVDKTRRILPDEGLEDLSLEFACLLFFLLPSALAFRGGLSSSSESYSGGQSSSCQARTLEETGAGTHVSPLDLDCGVSHLLPRLPLLPQPLAPLFFLPHCWSRALSLAGLWLGSCPT